MRPIHSNASMQSLNGFFFLVKFLALGKKTFDICESRKLEMFKMNTTPQVRGM